MYVLVCLLYIFICYFCIFIVCEKVTCKSSKNNNKRRKYILYIYLSQVGDEASRRVTRGVEDLDFFIGDEAMAQTTPYAVKVRKYIIYLIIG